MKVKVHLRLIVCLVFFANLSFIQGYTPSYFNPDTIHLPSELFKQTNDCTAKLDLCLDDLANPGDLQITVNDSVYTGSIANCQEDSSFIYTLFTLYGFGKLGPYHLDKWEVNGQVFSGFFQNPDELLILMNNWDPAGNWTYDPNTFLISGGKSGSDYSEMDVTVLSLGGAKGYIGLNIGINGTGVKIFLETGKHHIIFTNTITNVSDTVDLQYVCVKPSVVYNTVQKSKSDVYCLDASELTGPIVSVINICPDHSGSNVTYSILANNCIQFTGLEVGVDTFCAKYCDANGICDTTTIITKVTPPTGSNDIVINIFELTDTLHCFDISQLPGNAVSMVNICPDAADGDVDFYTNNVDYCVFLTGLSVGSDTACYVICTDSSYCDTFKLIVNVLPLPKADTVYLKVKEKNSIVYCLDLSELPNGYKSIENICPNAAGDNAKISFDFASACMGIKGLKAPGKDTACYVVCDASNICDTIIVIIDVYKDPNPPKVIDITIEYNEVISYCIDTTQLSGNLVSITNVCPDKSGVNADVAPDPATYCVYALGILPGVDSACIVVCTDAGICDTTIIIYHVVEHTDPTEIIVDVVEGTTIQYCIDQYLVCTPIISVQNFCPDKLFDNSEITPGNDPLCFNIAGINPGGKDTLCLNICCDFGNCDTVFLIINVLPASHHKLIQLTVKEEEFLKYCIDPNTVCSPILSVQNICQGSAGTYAQIAYEPNTGCVLIDGLEAGGTDSICLVFNCGNVTDTVIVAVHVIKDGTKEVVNLSVPEGETMVYCLDPTALCSPILSIENICPGASGENAIIDFDASTGCAFIQGIKANGADSLCLVIKCAGQSDTVIVIVQVTPPVNKNLKEITIKVGDEILYCFDEKELCSPILSVENICPDASGENALIQLDPYNICAKITGFKQGDDSLCLVVNCGTTSDTVTLIVHVLPYKNNQTVEVTVEKGKTLEYCFTEAGVCMPVLSIENICGNTVFDNSSIVFDSITLCAKIKGVAAPGTDTLCLAFCCGPNKCDTVTLLIHVIEKNNPPLVVNLTIDVTDTIQYCLDLSDLSTGVASIQNLCPQQSGNYTQSSFDPVTNCFTFIGVQPFGQDIFCMVACDSTGFCDTTIIFVNVIPKIITPETVNLTVYEGATVKYCLDTTEIGSAIVSFINFCPQSMGQNASMSYDSNTHCIEFKGIQAFGTDTACIVICGSNGFCDTTTIIVQVVKKQFPDTLYFNVKEGGSLQHCFDPDLIGGNISSIVNICPQQSGTNAAYFYLLTDTCVTIVGIAVGGPDTACFVICNNLGYCDTVTLITNVYKDDVKIVYDTILVHFKDTLCFDISGFDPNTIKIENICPDESGTFVDFVISGDTACVYYIGIGIGTDTACIKISDADSNSLLTHIIVTVIPPAPDIITDIIHVDSTKVYCLDTTELAGNVLSVVNICPDQSSGNISYTINEQTACVTVTGLVPGKDTLCLVYCDTFGICDSTTIFITVIENNANPIAVDDSVSTNINVPVVINVLGNDVNPGGAGVVTILPPSLGGTGPNHGTATVNADGSITYIPDDGYCGEDIFTYLLCIGQNCDPAVVIINIECPPNQTDTLEVFNGFSPNGDGKNDVFTIKNIEKFPDNKLYIFNRWGNRVYFEEKYLNTWEGTWENKPLPDGTYFYIIEDGKGKTYSGYLVIYR